MKPRIPAPGYIAIECSTCDPPSVVHVRVDAEITLPYSCTVCIKRGLHRLENREQPLVGRMKHGESLVGEGRFSNGPANQKERKAMTQGFMPGEDRYKALGVPYPDPETMCKGDCEGLGVYPQSLDDITITDEERRRWQALHDASDAHRDGPCDGCHFITCPDCEGTGLDQKEQAHGH